MTPLHTACGCGNTSVAEVLLSRGADDTLRDRVRLGVVDEVSLGIVVIVVIVVSVYVCVFRQHGLTAIDAARLFEEALSKSQLSSSQDGVDVSLLAGSGSGSVYEDHGESSQSSLQGTSMRRGSSHLSRGSRGSTNSAAHQHQLYSLSAESGVLVRKAPSMLVKRLLQVVDNKAVEDWNVDDLRDVFRAGVASSDTNVSVDCG